MTAVKVCQLSELADGLPRQVEVDGQPVLVVQVEGELFAVSDTCSHADISLVGGEIEAGECAVECPKHGSLFSLRTGEALTMPATQPIEVFAVSVEDQEVVISHG
jgi:3-phenylpropionate/trans-cinnamate dioxygenase ferredoxin component